MMIKQALLDEFLYEAENTRKLLNAIPDSALDYRPQPHLWSVAELASHVAEIYNWYDGTFNHDHFDMAHYAYDKGDISRSSAIVQKFEENYSAAKQILEKSDEATYMTNWSMGADGQAYIGPAPRILMVRGFLFNHLYHHRGELIAHLRASGHQVPGLYGPTYEESQ